MVYDINTEDKAGQKRLVKIMKTCRKYLSHVQKSVFEGELTEGKLVLLKRDLAKIVDKERDFIIVYALNEGSKWQRDILTNTPDPTNNIL